MKEISERGIEILLLLCGAVSVLSVIFISIFIFESGLPLFQHISPWEFLTSTDWYPTREPDPGYGILSFIMGSIYVTFGALVLAVPVGLAFAVFMAEIAHPVLARFLKVIVELLAGIPSVIYGFFGVVVLCSWVRNIFGGTGYNMISASIILAIMTLPTIINVAEVSIRAVPEEFRAGSLALGSTQWHAIVKVVLPSAKSGIVAGIVLGMGRAMGETMAVLMVAGNAPIMPDSPLSGVRTLTMNIVTDMGYASGDHMTALFTTSIVLFIFIMILNLTVQYISGKGHGE